MERSEGSVIRHASSPCKVCEQILHCVQDDKPFKTSFPLQCPPDFVPRNDEVC